MAVRARPVCKFIRLPILSSRLYPFLPSPLKTFTRSTDPISFRYRIDLEAIHITQTGAILQVINIGTFKNDTLSPRRKANGKSFEAQACYVLQIAEDGLIQKVDEYQSIMFDEGTSVDKYTLRE